MRVLIVDDVQTNRSLPLVLLKRAGHEVAEACNGEEALASLEAASFDLVLLDISMPGMSGLEVCKQIRATPGLAGMRLVAYTAHAMPEEREAILAAGFDELLIKPINREQLYAALEG